MSSLIEDDNSISHEGIFYDPKETYEYSHTIAARQADDFWKSGSEYSMTVIETDVLLYRILEHLEEKFSGLKHMFPMIHGVVLFRIKHDQIDQVWQYVRENNFAHVLKKETLRFI